ncbi:MAG: transglutaminase domain-containing protein [Agriterribacter sp.]
MKLLTLMAMLFCINNAIADTTRYISLTYTAYITNLPEGAKEVRWWIPVAASDERQTVQLLPGDQSTGQLTKDTKYNNQILYKQVNITKANPNDTLKVVLRYQLALNEKNVPEAKNIQSTGAKPVNNNMHIYLTDNRLIPLKGPVEKLYQQLQLPGDPIAAARKTYDYLIDNMVYDYKAPGAGIGDVLWACNSKTGDCSDYHSVFIGVCRYAGIPADHVFELPLKKGTGSGTVKDWHCWARFYAGKPGWITIDASEADKHPELRDYLFGSLSNVYLTLSHGRDVILSPAQKGPPINIFADPYAEVDGVKFENVKWLVSFAEQ